MTRARKLWIAAGVAAVLTTTAYLHVSLTYQLEHGDTWSVGDIAVHSDRDQAVH